ncbi:hypothetical protein [Aliamphritea spongicola]|uniref:hypothetical protein n=1 Tax=Aliamphritea spongicola TaxID=707589 RepID=UPI00196B0B96|nr:hypothetical protein [Aliamphritea spongicola]MBN3561281.1 hypothetical protein [Aliamphritea spongicola]
MSKFYTAERVTINSLNDLTQRPGFSDTVRPLRSEFRYVVAAYSFPRKIASCSVTNCYQNHKKGFLVHTAHGRECCLCDSCARKLMPAEMLKPPRAAKVSNRPATPKTRTVTKNTPAEPAADTVVLSLSEIRQRCSDTKTRVDTLKKQPRGASWLYQSVRNFRQTCPSELFEALKSLHQQGENSPVIEQMIEADASDAQLADIENLQGLGVFNGDIRQLLIDTCLKGITELDKKLSRYNDSDTLQLPENWFDEISQALASGEQLIAEASLFFTPENLQRLASLPLEDKARQKIRKLQWDCDKGTAR